MSTQPLPSAFGPVEYHWIATVQLPSGVIATHDDVFTADGPITRFETFRAACDALKNKYQVTDLVVLHWDLAPNHMTGGAS